MLPQEIIARKRDGEAIAPQDIRSLVLGFARDEVPNYQMAAFAMATCTNALKLIEDIRLIYDNYQFDTEILAASLRHPIHVLECAKIGADVITAPPAVIKMLSKHVLTDKGLEGFAADWAKTGQTIL